MSDLEKIDSVLCQTHAMLNMVMLALDCKHSAPSSETLVNALHGIQTHLNTASELAKQ